MNLRQQLGTAVIIMGVAWINASGHAHADIPGTCEHRGEFHAKQHGMSPERDSHWHVEHGERPTCGLDDKHDDHHSDEHHNDSDLPGHRDHPGFHCVHLHCG